MAMTERYQDKSCDPCKTLHEKHSEDVHGFCVQCVEYLCKTCVEHHRKLKASRSHVILTGQDIPDNKTAFQLLEKLGKCPTHEDEEITYECKQHEKFLCVVCAKNEHMECGSLVEISLNLKPEIHLTKLSNIQDKLEDNKDEIRLLKEDLTNKAWNMTKQANEIKEKQMSLRFKLENALHDLKRQEQMVEKSCKNKLEIVDSNKKKLNVIEKKIELSKQFAQIVAKYGRPSQIYIVANGQFEHSETDIKALKDDKVSLNELELGDFDIKSDILNLLLTIESSRVVCDTSSDSVDNGSHNDDISLPQAADNQKESPTTARNYRCKTYTEPTAENQEDSSATARIVRHKVDSEPTADNQKESSATAGIVRHKVDSKPTAYNKKKWSDFIRIDSHMVDTEPTTENKEGSLATVNMVRHFGSSITSGLKQIHLSTLMDRSTDSGTAKTVLFSGENKQCDIVGVDTIDALGLIILADYGNTSLKVFESNFTALNRKSLHARPCSLCTVENGYVAVLLVDKTIVMEDVTKEAIKHLGTFNIRSYGHSLTNYGNNLAVLCSDTKFNSQQTIYAPIRVLVINRNDGDVIKELDEFYLKPREDEKEVRFKNPCQIYSRSSSELIIGTHECIRAFHSDGVQRWYYGLGRQLRGASGITSDNEDNLYVCGYDSNNVHQISSLSYASSRVLIPEIEQPWTITFDKTEERLIVSSRHSNTITIHTFRKT